LSSLIVQSVSCFFHLPLATPHPILRGYLCCRDRIFAGCGPIGPIRRPDLVMQTISQPPCAGATNEDDIGFPDGGAVDVREVDDNHWRVLKEFSYRGFRECFVVPAGERTDFASVPRPFVWFIPRYGRYTKAAILHDHLCRLSHDGR